MRFGNTIRELRRAKGFTLRVLGERVGVSFAYISKVENGKIDFGDYPGEDLIRRLAAALDADEEELLLLAEKILEPIRRQRRQFVADLPRDTPAWNNRRMAERPGVDHHMVASVRSEIIRTGGITQLERTTGLDGRERAATRTAAAPANLHRLPEERQGRSAATTLHQGDCRKTPISQPA